jgi:nucleotide-binding universal stress UspA family protein
LNTKRILVAYDGTEQSYWALQQAAQAAVATEAEIGVVTVMPTILDAPGHALRYLGDFGLDPELHVPINTDPVGEIARVAADGAYDIVYVGRRGDRLVRRGADSVSRGVVMSAPAKVLVAS